MTRILSIAAAVLSVVALVVALTGGGSPPPIEEDSAAPAPTEARARTSGDLEARLGAVEMHLSSLLRRVDALERTPSAQAAAPAPRVPEPVEEDVAVLDRDQLKETVRQVQDEVRAERLQLRTQAREDQRAERLQRFFEEARVTPTQQDQIREILAQEAAQLRGAGGTRVTPGTNREAAREAVRAARRNADEAIGRVLSPDQAELFKQVRHEERPQRPSRRLDLRDGAGSGARQGSRPR